MRINTNLAAINTQRNLSSVQGNLAKSVERLSSGLRINRAGDDAAGLTISEKLRGQVKGLNQAMRNAQDGISMIQTAEGGLNETHTILQRMRELAVQGANETLTDQDREAIGSELTSLRTEIDRIATTTEFNTKALLDGSLGTGQASLHASSGWQPAEDLGTSTTDTTVASISVAGASANTTYTLTAANVNGADGLIMSDGSNTQFVAVSAMAANSNQSLDFSEFGVTINLNQANNGNAATAANIAADLEDQDVVTAATSTNNSATFQVGANVGTAQTVSVSIASSATAVIGDATDFDGPAGAGTATSLNAAVAAFATTPTTAEANDLIKSLDVAIKNVSDSRSNLGAVQNRLEHTIENLSVSAENLQASESRIRDADMAAEMVGFTRSNILQQAGTSILAQANQLPQGVLSLLR